MVIAVLGILKAGAVYVPLDPQYPPERLRFMLDDIGATLVLTQDSLCEVLPVGARTTLRLDSEWATVGQSPETNPVRESSAHNLAYVIYTSGSTGQPKGVSVAHQGIVNRLWWMQDAYQLTEQDRVLQKTPYSFDVSGWEFFWPLMSGAQLVMAKPEGHKDPVYLSRLIDQQQITTIHFVPSMLQVFLEHLPNDSAHSLERVICSGEALPAELQQRFYKRLKAKLYNLYGPTEASIDVTAWSCQPEGASASVPIGKPIANTQVYVLDRHLNPVPIGVPGELYLGGVGLARGYVNRPGLTAQVFIPNLFSEEAGTRLYKTGDRVRYLADGTIDYLGRIDNQVKLRGFRIELGEIEAILRQHPVVKDAVVVLREDKLAHELLAAYLVTQAEESVLDTQALKAFLSERLPKYMMPTSFTPLEKLPLTLSGKLDRKDLPMPDFPTAEQCYVAPRTPTEKRLAEIWADVLELERVGMHDNFFELGGHSLLATQVISRVKQAYPVELPVRSIFESPTVSAVAQHIDSVIQTDANIESNFQEIMKQLEELEELSDLEISKILVKKRALHEQ
jgi:amino acid adenylation domain-containing protein